MADPLLLDQLDKTAKWMRRGGQENDIVISSRARLARNLQHYNFPQRAEPQELIRIRERIYLALESTASRLSLALFFLPFEEFTGWERLSLIDRHLTSQEHIKEELGRALVTNSEGSVSLLINEEDHLRMQCVLPGMQFDAAFSVVNRIDDVLEGYFDKRQDFAFAFDNDFGFLTACPSNMGTGLRVSAMLHLPAMEITGAIADAELWAAKHGHVLRGTFGESSKAHGGLYQLSNQVTLGIDETDIILSMEKSTLELCERERSARSLLPVKYGTVTRDRMGRALGILQYARSISCQEASDCLSLLRLAQEMEWATGFTRQRFNELLVWIRPATIQISEGHTISSSKRDAIRADTLRPYARRTKFTQAFGDETSGDSIGKGLASS